ncbi:MAG: restriction endonuclease [Selenomonadaceae bacterium]|nr:restriction endonuclease [Selenomonadaceae bacterium]
MTWQETASGYFFPRANLSAAIESKLEMLSLEDFAQAVEGGILIPFAKSVGLTEEDAELLHLPPHNPYQVSIRTEGYIGKDFRYVVKLLNADGRPVIKPQINGALVHVGENLFRLNANQFALINLVEFGNKNLPRAEALLNVKRIQDTASRAAANLEGYISAGNKKIVVPDKLSVDFQDSGDGFKVQPVLLENHDGKLEAIDSADFQRAFDKRKRIVDTYTSRDGKTQYIFTETLRDGLAQIKSVGTLSKTDAERYKAQPKELFTGEAFDFDYSDRVIGIEEVPIGTYQDIGGAKINWTEEDFLAAPPKPKEPIERPTILALKIKENFERVDYATNLTARQGRIFIDVLKPGVKLKDYQLFGVWKMSQIWQDGWRGVLLADDMGLGKTLQTLTFIGGLKRFRAVTLPILIVAPTALLENWQAEYKKFLRNILGEVIDLHGDGLRKFFTDERTPNGRKKLSLMKLPTNALALTTYETLRDYQFSFGEIPWGVIIADEAQKIKNPDAGITKALKAMKYDFALCLSGTPVENSWRDLWSIMDFVHPAKLADLKTFTAKYLDRLTGENISQLGEELKRELEPLLIRRMKEDNLPALPDKKIFICREEMPPYQSKIYSTVLEKYRRGGFSTPLNFIDELSKVSLHPDLATMSEKSFFELDAAEVINRSARLIKTFAFLDEIKARAEKVLIFVTSLKMQAILRRLLEETFGIKVLPPINGKMNGAARQRLIDAFKRTGGFNVLILSPEAAGVGFTITEANNVIHLSRTWNPAKENQATDRAYRIGQNKSVNVYLPFAVNQNLPGKTFDENLDLLLSYKKILSANVLFPTAETAADIKTLAAWLATTEENSAAYWTIEDVDAVERLVFEKIICDLFNAMENFSAEKTPATNDYGADVVAKSADGTGLLIQCKHTTNPIGSIGNKGVQEIFAAVGYYERIHQLKFRPLVITNAKSFTAGARELAKQNGVRLIARRELEDLFRKHKVLRC